MIKLDFAWFVTILISLVPVLVLWSWIFYTIKERNVVRESSVLEQCSFCTYLVFDYSKSRFKNCPRCQSLTGGEEKT